MKTMRVKQKLSPNQVERLRHIMLDQSNYDEVLRRSPVTVIDHHTEEFVLAYLPAALSRGATELAFAHLRNRGHNTMNSHRLALRGMPGKEMVLGFLDQHGRCTLTASTVTYLEHFVEGGLPLVWECDTLVKEYRPEEYAYLLDSADPRFLLPSPSSGLTVVSTMTVNFRAPTRAHTDPGNSSISLLTVIRAGHFRGGELISVPYRLAVPLFSGDLLIMKGNLMHGSTAQVGEPGTYERLALVLYTRQKMRKTLS
jgi:hypothetical protein